MPLAVQRKGLSKGWLFSLATNARSTVSAAGGKDKERYEWQSIGGWDTCSCDGVPDSIANVV